MNEPLGYASTANADPESSSSDLDSGYFLSKRQRLFIRYLTAILMDLVVLNLMAEYWHQVHVESFAMSLVAAVVLQGLLQATMRLEHGVAHFFNQRSGATAKFLRYFTAWAILFSSKFVILEAVIFASRGAIAFHGPVHGVVAFISLILAMLVAEQAVLRLYRRLA